MSTPVAPAYTAEEQELAVASLLRLNNSIVLDFFANHGIKRAYTKAEMKVRLTDALEAGTVSHGAIFLYLNPIESWGRQHVILFDGPKTSIDRWRDPEWVAHHIANCGLKDQYNSTHPHALPKELTLSSISHSVSKIRISGVERREGVVREPDLDTERPYDDDTIFYKAYRYQVYRGHISFEWDLVSNTAFLQISQLPSGEKYEDASARFDSVINNLLSLNDFSALCLRPVIKRLHELEEQKTPEARSHGIAYKTLQGRTVEGRGASGSLGLFGETVIDTTMATVRSVSIGHTGNFYWLTDASNSSNPLTQEVHVILIGDWRRINFPVYYPEESIRYVLQRIRSIASGPP
jgi:hypothetical protein